MHHRLGDCRSWLSPGKATQNFPRELVGILSQSQLDNTVAWTACVWAHCGTCRLFLAMLYKCLWRIGCCSFWIISPTYKLSVAIHDPTCCLSQDLFHGTSSGGSEWVPNCVCTLKERSYHGIFLEVISRRVLCSWVCMHPDF